MNKRVVEILVVVMVVVAGLAFSGSLFTDVTSEYGPSQNTQINAALDALEDNSVAQTDTNAVPVTTSYTPVYVGQILVGTASNQVWIAKGTTTNDWIQVSN